MVLSWPLPRVFDHAIPSSAQNIEHPSWRYMIVGDHLQLLYHFDLVHDMMTGRIPWFHNPYEFNTGNDAERYRASAYFFPMSGVYALGRHWLGQAAAWNLTMMLSVVISIFFYWLWLRRFTASGPAIAIGILVVVFSPFRWISLFGGSPSGIGLLWLPVLLWSLDTALRKPTLLSGIWLGGSLLLSFWADLHNFYFVVLFLPVFALLSLISIKREALPIHQWWRNLPAGLFFFALMLFYFYWRNQHLADSSMTHGRGWEEIRIFSPVMSGFVWGGQGSSDSVYLGLAVFVLLGAAWLRFIGDAMARRRSPGLSVIMIVVIPLALVVAGSLALGVNGPGEGFMLRAARKVFPMYGMIRQPFKICAVIPLLVGWYLAVGLSPGPGTSPGIRRCLSFFLVAGAAGMIGQYLSKYSATICRLEPHQAAYEHLRPFADRPEDIRMLVVPLWPGDAVDTSLPMHYVQKYGYRMVNGYSPVVHNRYFDGVFRRLDSVNQGWLNDEQIDFLLDRGIRFVLVHENQFPAKVSPFPVSETLRRFHAHPRMAFLIQSEAVHAFRLLPANEARRSEDISAPRLGPLFPARRWEVEHQEKVGGVLQHADNASGRAFIRYTAGETGFRTRLARVAPDDDLHWWIRWRGEGQVSFTTLWGGNESTATNAVSHPTWTWTKLPVVHAHRFEPVMLNVRIISGDMDFDTVLLGAGDWPLNDWPAQGLTIPAAVFFRAGYTDQDGTSIVLRADHDPDRVIFYGPQYPLPEGPYDWEIIFSSPASDGEELARAGIQTTVGPVESWVMIRAGEPARVHGRSGADVPASLNLHFLRRHDLTLHAIRITRATEKAGPEPLP